MPAAPAFNVQTQSVEHRLRLLRQECAERGISIIEEPGKVTLCGEGVYIVCTSLRDVHPRDLRG